LVVEDEANVSDIVSTQWQVIIKTTHSDNRFRPVSDYQTLYEGPVPQKLVQSNGNSFTLNLGNLPLNSKALQTGLGIMIQLKATRSLGNYSDQQTLVYTNLINNY